MRPLAMVGFGLLLFAAPILQAQRGSGGIQFHGTPASVTSPGMNGAPRGISASVTDPTFRNQYRGSVNYGHEYGHNHGHYRYRPIYSVPYYGYYGLYDFYDGQQQQQPTEIVQQPAPQVIIVHDSPAQAETHDSARLDPPPAPKADAKPEEVQPTTLVFRDGHKAEVQNYAIVGGNLIDLTKSPVLKKIPLASLDLEATRRENEDNGVDFHLP